MDGLVGSLEGVSVGLGLVPTIALNWPRKLLGELKPTWREMRSMEWVVASSKYCDRRIRDRRSKIKGQNPIVPFAADSSFGCAICDPVIALWCFAGAPSVYDLLRRRKLERPNPTP